ncbi:MAG TPA: hypothetical protein VK882_06575 [Nitrososphaeraceae archaeon]|nr:hypothetical protein [Nitrososphaeraceae archaeon]
MIKKRFHSLFLPLIVSGIIISTFGIFLFFLGQSIKYGEGFEIVGIRFIIAGIATIALGCFAQYYTKIRNSLLILKYFLGNINNKKKLFK